MIYLLVGVLGFAAGMATGWQLGGRYRPHTSERTSSMPNRPLPRRRAYVIFGILLAGLLLTGVGVAVSWFRAAEASRQAQTVTEQLLDFSRCQARYQQRFALIYSARIKPTGAVFEALDRTFFAVIGKNSEDFSKSLQHYVDVRQRQMKALKNNPPPPLPKKVCGLPPEVDTP